MVIKYLKDKFFYVLLAVTMIIAFSFRGFVASSDGASSWFSPFYNLKDLVYVWSNYYAQGSYLPQNFSSFFLRLFYSFISVFNNNPEFIQKFAWIIFFIFFGCICLFMINKEIKNMFLSYISVLFLFFNPIAQHFLWAKQHWSYYLIIPYFLAILFYFKFCSDKKFKYALIISLIWFIFGFVFNQPAYFGSFILITLIIFIFQLFKEDKKFKWILANIQFLFIFILINSVYIIPLMLGGTGIIESSMAKYGNNDPIPILRDLKSLNFFFSMTDITRGYGYFYSDNLWFITAWTLFFIIILAYSLLYTSKEERKKLNSPLIWGISLIIFIFLLKGISKPFSDASLSIYSFKWMYIFRDFKDKLSIGYSIILSFLFIFLIKRENKIVKGFLISLSVIFLFLFISNFWLSPNFTYSDNLNYFKDSKFDNLNYRIINLPIADYSFFYTVSPSYSGDNPLRNIIHKEIIYTTLEMSDNSLYSIKESLKNNSTHEEDLINYLKTRNVRYILNNKNSYIKEDSDPNAYNYKILSRYPSLTKISENEKFDIYEFKDYFPRTFSNSLSFQKINPTKYHLYIKDLKNPQNLSFLESYNKDWKLYLIKKPEGECNILKYYQNTNTSECESNTRFFEGEELSYLYKEPLFEDSHQIIYDYANGWTIDSEYIKDNYSPEYYKQNADGSIDVELVMYFKPQSYFYLGLIISGTALIICIIYLAYDLRKSKNKGLKTDN